MVKGVVYSSIYLQIIQSKMYLNVAALTIIRPECNSNVLINMSCGITGKQEKTVHNSSGKAQQWGFMI